jgi:hypothetical protein
MGATGTKILKSGIRDGFTVGMSDLVGEGLNMLRVCVLSRDHSGEVRQERSKPSIQCSIVRWVIITQECHSVQWGDLCVGQLIGSRGTNATVL